MPELRAEATQVERLLGGLAADALGRPGTPWDTLGRPGTPWDPTVPRGTPWDALEQLVIDLIVID